jgi:ABC-type antimicrobial peptide transport system permease subunit
MLGAFAATALLIAAIGTYSVLAYSVSRRTSEIGLRMAIGARPASVVQLILREGMTLAAAGIGAGVLAALALGRALESLVFGVSVWDPATYAAVCAALAAVALVACLLPARRASRVDPIVALREQ